MHPAKSLSPRHFDRGQLAVVHARAGGAENYQTGHGIIGDRIPGIAAADLP